MTALGYILKILLQHLPILITESTQLILPPDLWVKVFLVGGGGGGGIFGGGGSGHLVENWVQVPASGKLSLTIGLGGDGWDWVGTGGVPGGNTIVQGEGKPITSAGGKNGTGMAGGAGWSGGGLDGDARLRRWWRRFPAGIRRLCRHSYLDSEERQTIALDSTTFLPTQQIATRVDKPSQASSKSPDLSLHHGNQVL